MDVKDGGSTIDIMPITGGDWTTSDTYEDGINDITKPSCWYR